MLKSDKSYLYYAGYYHQTSWVENGQSKVVDEKKYNYVWAINLNGRNKLVNGWGIIL